MAMVYFEERKDCAWRLVPGTQWKADSEEEYSYIGMAYDQGNSERLAAVWKPGDDRPIFFNRREIQALLDSMFMAMEVKLPLDGMNAQWRGSMQIRETK